MECKLQDLHFANECRITNGANTARPVAEHHQWAQHEAETFDAKGARKDLAMKIIYTDGMLHANG